MKNDYNGLRDVRRWNKTVFWHGEGILKKISSPVKTGIHSFSYNGLIYDILIENKNSDITIFFFHASIERKGKKLPFFMGNRVLSDKKVNRVFISDPSLLMSKDLSLAWYAGLYRETRVQQVLKDTIKVILKYLNSKRNVFFGPSNGGFAALYFSWFFPNSLAFVMNPQTRIADFTFQTVKKFSKECLSISTDNIFDQVTLHKEIMKRTDGDVRVLYEKKVDNIIVYLQNRTDHHVELQMKPFLKSIKQQSKVNLILGDWGEGHKAPPIDVINKYLTYYCFNY
ncbi:hypothetical protein [Nitrosophilus labii]|uniref:hypothetical protein n=1 Tax=Nitrosophilus labii TaxID=2706014 RepID=UPI0016575E5F|nr:hypothetical protein [Nitrosophilus labii]